MRRVYAFVQLASAAVLMGCMAAFSWRPLAPPAIEPACVYASAPILCAELPSSGAALTQVLHTSPNRVADWVFALWIDMPFIAAYVALLGISALRFRGRIALVAGVAIVLAGFCDVAENAGILRAAAGASSDTVAAWVRSFALVKFALCSVTCAGTFLVRARATVNTALRVLFGGAALVCIVGVGCLVFERLVLLGFLATVVSAIAATVDAVRASKRS